MAQRLHTPIGLGESSLCLLILRVQSEFARVETGHLGFERRELALGRGRAGACILALGSDALDLRGSRLPARARRSDAAGQASKALPAIGLRADSLRDATLLFSHRALSICPDRRGLGEQCPIGLHLSAEGELLLAQSRRLRFEGLGIAATLCFVFDLGPDKAKPLGRQGGRAEESLAQGRQGKPGLLRRREEGRSHDRLRVECRLLRRKRGEMALHFESAFAQGRLVRHLGGERLAELSEVISHEAQSGIARLGLNHRGSTGDFGLAAQGLELPAELGREVRESREIALHRIELAQGLLLALAVLEDAGSLLDEATAVLGCRVEDRIELPLAHDHVHLAADAGVRQQLLDVEQPARGAIDGVLRSAIAEESARDRDLGVLDRKRTVGVVDRQGDLSPPERCPTARPREDHVRHRATAQ